MGIDNLQGGHGIYTVCVDVDGKGNPPVHVDHCGLVTAAPLCVGQGSTEFGELLLKLLNLRI